MDVGARIRIGLAAGVVAAAAGAVTLAGTVEAGPPVFVPDLRTVSPGPDALDLVQSKDGKRMTLRLSNKIANAGTGPLEFYATDATGSCDPGDDPLEPDRNATQVLYGDSAPGNGVYDPDDDPESESKVGCFEYHSAHGHWHFQDFSQFRLDELDGDPVEGIEPSRKIGFCVIDGARQYDDPPLPGSPPNGVYPRNTPTGVSCGQGNPQDGPGAMGLSVGYADLYSRTLPGQRLDVTGVVRGTYCLVSIANPPDGPSEIVESDGTNNERRKPIRINAAKEKAKFLAGTCEDPTP